MRTGARGIPRPISTSGQMEMTSMCGLRCETNLPCTIPPAGIKADAFADDNCGSREIGQRPFPVARTIPRSIPAKIKWWIGYRRYQ
jgi:hypothetical protein